MLVEPCAENAGCRSSHLPCSYEESSPYCPSVFESDSQPHIALLLEIGQDYRRFAPDPRPGIIPESVSTAPFHTSGTDIVAEVGYD